MEYVKDCDSTVCRNAGYLVNKSTQKENLMSFHPKANNLMSN